MRVECYWNRSRDCWSIRDLITRRIKGYADHVLIRDPHYIVRQGGTFAFVRGELEGWRAVSQDRATTWREDSWMASDRRYCRFALQHGARVRRTPAGLERQNGDSWEPIERGAMVLLSRDRLGPAARDFDPLTMPGGEG